MDNYPEINNESLYETIKKTAEKVFGDNSFNDWVIYPEITEYFKNNDMDERLKNVSLIKELDFTFIDVEGQLIEDEKRYGNTWKERGLLYNDQSQEVRFHHKMIDYFNDYNENGTPMPWKKIIGEAHIALVREKKLSE